MKENDLFPYFFQQTLDCPMLISRSFIVNDFEQILNPRRQISLTCQDKFYDSYITHENIKKLYLDGPPS